MHTFRTPRAEPGSPTWSAIGTLFVALTLLVWLGPAPAYAHDTLVSSSPSQGEVFEASPEEVSLIFSGPIQDLSPQVLITSSEGDQVAMLTPAVDGTDVTAALVDPLPDGTFNVAWRVVSSDGHPISGQFSFTIGDEDQVQEAGSNPDASSEGDSASHEVSQGFLGGHGEHIAIGAGAIALALLGIGAVAVRRHRS